MKLTSNKIIFFGNERLATAVTTTTPVLAHLIEAGYEVVAVVSNYQAPASRQQRSLEIAETAKQYNIPLLLPQKLSDISARLIASGASTAVLVAYGKIISQQIIDLFPKGIVNIHPSLLPHYRGPTPLEQTILDGRTRTGVSLMRLGQEMDSGPIYAQASVSLAPTETKQALADRLLALGGELLIKNLPKIIDGSLQPKPQVEADATYCNLISKQDGLINWQKSAQRLTAEIRAYLGWPGSRTRLFDKEVIILAAHVVDGNGQPGTINAHKSELLVFTGDQTLAIDSIKPAGKQAMSGQAFLAGYQLKR